MLQGTASILEQVEALYSIADSAAALCRVDTPGKVCFLVCVSAWVVLVTAELCLQESAAEAAKATPQGTDAATSCCDAELAIAPNADTDSTAAATESSSPKRAYMQLYSAKEMNENVDINACASNSKGSHDAANMGQAQGVGSQHTPLPAIAEVDITTDDSILGIAKAVLHQEFASIPRYAAALHYLLPQLNQRCSPCVD